MFPRRGRQTKSFSNLVTREHDASREGAEARYKLATCGGTEGVEGSENEAVQLAVPCGKKMVTEKRRVRGLSLRSR